MLQCVGDEVMGSTHLEEQEAVAVALASAMSSNVPFPCLEILPHSGIKIPGSELSLCYSRTVDCTTCICLHVRSELSLFYSMTVDCMTRACLRCLVG